MLSQVGLTLYIHKYNRHNSSKSQEESPKFGDQLLNYQLQKATPPIWLVKIEKTAYIADETVPQFGGIFNFKQNLNKCNWIL